MAVTGPIAERTRALIPITWDALSGDAARYGDGPLTTTLNTVKENVFGEVITEADEDLLPLVVIDYMAKRYAIELLTAAIDYWLAQPIAVTTRDPVEVTTYEERIAALRLTRREFLLETKAMEPDIAILVGYRRSVSNVPLSNTTNEDFLTPSPLEFPRPYARTSRS